MKALNCYVESWRRYRDFRGRSSRSAYWWPALIHPIVFFVLGGIFAAIFDISSDQIGPEIIYFIGYLWVSIALGVRRLHDIGRSGKWLLIGLVPLANLVLLYWFVQPSSAETNKWGDSSTTAGGSVVTGGDESDPPQQMSDIIR